MSQVARRICSSSSQGECSAPFGRLPRSFSGIPETAFSQSTCASCQLRARRKSSRTPFSSIKIRLHAHIDFRLASRIRSNQGTHLARRPPRCLLQRWYVDVKKPAIEHHVAREPWARHQLPRNGAQQIHRHPPSKLRSQISARIAESLPQTRRVVTKIRRPVIP